MESAGLHVLAESDEAGVHMAVSDDDFSFVFFQGHPEYDGISLLKEYKREVGRFIAGERDDYPPYPEHYFDSAAMVKLDDYKQRVIVDRPRCADRHRRQPEARRSRQGNVLGTDD